MPSKSRLPAFTAEASLYCSDIHYSGSVRDGLTRSVSQVVPQAYFCDVCRDYYRDRDTGDFLGWASDPYACDCIDIGDSGGGIGGGPGGGIGGGGGPEPSPQAQRCFECQDRCIDACDALRDASYQSAYAEAGVEATACVLGCAPFGLFAIFCAAVCGAAVGARLGTNLNAADVMNRVCINNQCPQQCRSECAPPVG